MCPTYVHERNDCGIVRPSDTTIVVGLMLVQQDGKPLYKTSTERYLKNQYYAGAPDYGALDPQSELPIIMEDWRSGYGLEVAASADPYRYYSSVGMDLRHRGMAIAGWTPTTVTLPTVPTIVNADMELDSSWEGAAGTQSSATAHGGTYSWKVAGTTEEVYQDSSWNDALQSKVVKFSCWVWADTANVGRIGISDKVGSTTYGTYHTGNSTWQLLTHTKTLAADATRCRWILNEEGIDKAVYFDDATPDGANKTTAFADFNDEFYASYKGSLIKLDAAGTAFTSVGCPGIITDLEPFPDNQLYLACGTTANYWYANTADTLAESTAGTATYQFFAAVHGATPTMWANDSVNTLRSTSAPSAAGTTWSGTTTVGSSYHSITDLISWKGLLYIMKEDKPFYIDSTPAVQDDLARELETELSTTSGKNAWVWKNELHIPCGDQALLHTDGTTNTFINPSKYCTNLTDFVGQVFAGAGDSEYNYVVVENASTTEVEVMATRIETIDGTTSRVYHPIAEIALKGCECCHISTKVRKALWVASDDITDSLYYLQLPTTYGDIINDSNKKCNTTDVSFITPGQHGGFKGENKYWRKATATLGHSYNTNVYYELHFMKLGAGDYSDPSDAAWVDAGNFVGTSASAMIHTLYLPANTAGISTVSPMMWFKLVAKSNDTALTPILLNLDIRTILKPTHRKIIECAVRCADNVLDRAGDYLEGTDAAYIRTVLDEARDATSPFTFYDIWGTSHTCIMLPNDPESEMVTDLKNENPEQIYYLRMQEVSVS